MNTMKAWKRLFASLLILTALAADGSTLTPAALLNIYIAMERNSGTAEFSEVQPAESVKAVTCRARISVTRVRPWLDPNDAPNPVDGFISQEDLSLYKNHTSQTAGAAHDVVIFSGTRNVLIRMSDTSPPVRSI